MENKKYTLEYIRENNLILLDAVSGSRAYNTHKETSDWDYRGVFIAELDDFLTGFYPEQVNDTTNDIVYYEIGRYFDLLQENNPNILELLEVPENCIKYRSDLMDLVRSEDFLSKLCKKKFGGYALGQMKGARGLDKKISNPMPKERKKPLDYCFVIEGHKSYPLAKLLEDKGMDQKFCGIVNVPNARDLFALYYDWKSHYCFSELVDEKTREAHKADSKKFGEAMGLGYKGLTKGGKSNELRLSAVSKVEAENVVCNFTYNKDSYTQHCKAHKEYWEWTEARNPDRYEVSKKANYDAKNMMHCYRIASMGIEIAKGEGLKVFREDREFLLKIRNGELTYDEIKELNEKLLKESDEAFDNCNLIDRPDHLKAKETLTKIRKQFYKIDK
jgi:predicted nucleotidyltransferase